ncbi:hypothetical protein DAEQUDRAFT_788403 [Daedalea quercina L-15889]|uniref:Uncharacterized protein n=1 Tax=Daedalea quercina L-15889 TaxID=1314783 RepID=A0A165PZG7_9APHY|nr:hypothetical protein DAEQUDRAFT_788403 [Daedalea quercina L-15889]
MSQTHLGSVHGPSLDGDNTEQIYDDWGGVLAAEIDDERQDELIEREDSLRDRLSGNDKSELEAVKWFAERHGATGLPEVKQVKYQRERILKATGLDPRMHEGALGDGYSACELERIIEDEFCNPFVRPFIFTYAEDEGEKLSEARHARKWLREVDPNAGGPMARTEQGTDYFVNEVAMANLDNLGVLYDDDPYAPLNRWHSPPINPWREKANGKRVLSLPLWLYCDDTSGNTSKKWNKHNSILLTLAGLPRKLAQLLYNIHFVCTSNVASPLEMMEYLVDKFRNTRENGIRVWDCLLQEYVLLVPWVLAFLGDNPMASEFASHIGMSGSCYCRVCKAHSNQQDPEERLDTFMKAGDPRTAANTRCNLEEQLKKALGGAPSGVDKLATTSGTKVKYFLHFVEKIQQMANRVRETMKNQAHQPDTPFEALHVILLGVVKYFWRDAVSRQSANGKETLKARLTSVNVAGLDISPLRAQTLVQYAGSLVGRDFRAVLQVAPLVLHGLIPDEAYEAWLALCRLAPMIFQPRIEDAPDYFFHLFLHLAMHIRRFGPAILCSTEGFESYNFVIRLCSIHSNRHAPSKDIADAFSYLHTVRHLVSGGWYHRDSTGERLSQPHQAGDGVLSLLQDDALVRLLGMDSLRTALTSTEIMDISVPGGFASGQI